MSKYTIVILGLSVVLGMLYVCNAAAIDNANNEETADETNLEIALANQVHRGLLAEILLKQRLAAADSDDDDDASGVVKRNSKYRTGNTRNKVSLLHANGHQSGYNRNLLAEKSQLYQNMLG
jgi:hypothetical protein